MLDGGETEHNKASKSFFRRVAEKTAALKKYWESLDSKQQKKWIKKATGNLLVEFARQSAIYSQLSNEKKLEKNEKGILKHKEPKEPIEKQKSKLARELAFTASGEKLTDWNRDTAIDYEVVFCMVKPA